MDMYITCLGINVNSKTANIYEATSENHTSSPDPKSHYWILCLQQPTSFNIIYSLNVIILRIYASLYIPPQLQVESDHSQDLILSGSTYFWLWIMDDFPRPQHFYMYHHQLLGTMMISII
ncbi:unnamed protein product [Absidia cylindrospora]